MRRWYAFCCSHGGNVVCIDGGTGAKIWETSVTGRAESGLALSADLKVRAESHSVCCARTSQRVPEAGIG